MIYMDLQCLTYLVLNTLPHLEVPPMNVSASRNSHVGCKEDLEFGKMPGVSSQEFLIRMHSACETVVNALPRPSAPMMPAPVPCNDDGRSVSPSSAVSYARGL